MVAALAVARLPVETEKGILDDNAEIVVLFCLKVITMPVNCRLTTSAETHLCGEIALLVVLVLQQCISILDRLWLFVYVEVRLRNWIAARVVRTYQLCDPMRVWRELAIGAKNACAVRLPRVVRVLVTSVAIPV